MNTFARIVGILLALFAMAGFGACGVLGLYLSVYASKDAGVFNQLTVYGLFGLAIAVVIAWRLYRALSSTGTPPAPPPPSGQ